MGTYLAVKLVLILVFVVVGIIARVAKGSGSTPANQNRNYSQPNQVPFPPANNPIIPNPPQVPTSGDPFEQNMFSTPQTNYNPSSAPQEFYCMYCGKKFGSVEALMRDTCFSHPNAGAGLQKHVLYQGAGKPNTGF